MRTVHLVALASCCTFAVASPIGAQPAPLPCAITGTIRAGQTPLPGVAVTLSGADKEPVDATSTAPDGSFSLHAPADGELTISASLTAFATATKPLTVAAASCNQRVDVAMILASRASAQSAAPAAPGTGNEPARPVTSTPDADSTRQNRPPRAQQQGGGVAAGQGARGGPGARSGRGGPTGGNGFQSLQLLADQAGGAEDGQVDGAQPLLPPGFSPETSSESVTSLGGSQAAGPAGFGDRPEFFGDGNGFGQGLAAGGGPGAFGGRAGFGGGPGGPGGPSGGGPGPIAFGGRLRNNNRIRGSIFQSFDSAALDAPPFSLNGQPTTKPGYFQQRLGATLGGPLVIPKLISSPKTFFFLNYTGNHGSNPFDAYGAVPTAAERSGDLSAIPTAIIDPLTGQPFHGNQIPSARLSQPAQALLNLIPLPNQPGARQNFHNQATTTSQIDDVNLRVIHNFGDAAQPGRPGGGRGGFGGGGGERFGAAGGNVQNLNVGIHYRRQDSNSASLAPSLGGTSQLSAWDIPVSYTFTAHGLVNTLRGDFNHQRSSSQNLFASNTNVAAQAGLLGVSTDPFDWGAPSLSFSSIASLTDVAPSLRINQTVSVGDQIIKSHGKHTFRFGGDYRDIRMDSRSDPNARGSFVFTGLYTGLDFADFLLGLPQQASVQLGAGLERFRQTSWDVYVQDDWRVRDTVTINAGIRYEYVSPFAEAQNRLTTLDVATGFVAATPVQAGGTGPYSGAFTNTIVNPDRNNVAPRVGIAWRPTNTSVVRVGYGINYSTSVYQNIAQQLANQPPFAFTNTIIATRADPLALGDALLNQPTGVTTNSYGVDPNFATPYVQIWTADVQRDFARTWNAGIGYVGTKGSSLDLLRAPNRAPTGGLRIAGVDPFIWESSGADSIMNAVTFRLRKRLTHGVAVGASYTLSKAIDDASSIGGGGSVVAQNDLDLAAERGLSSFDQRHRFSADSTFELPFGADKRWFTDGVKAAIFGGWVLNANAQFASGTPFTARVLSNVFDVSNGTNGTLRANYNGDPITVSDPTTTQWFNTAAFSIPAPGTFGNAGRNTIIGPGTTNVNFGITRNITFAQNRVLSVQVMANNVFDTPQYSAIDAVVNSRTFGEVTAARAPRRLQVITRFRF